MNIRNWKPILTVAVLSAALLVNVCAVAQEAFDEAATIGVLQSGATAMEKEAACRALRQKGTVASVPALAALLTDQELSHMARYALDAMPFPEAAQALRDAVAKAEGAAKVGVIISLGARRDAEAVAVLAPALRDANPDVANAAAGALGRIGTRDAVSALLKFRKDAPASVRPALAEGLLASGQYLVKGGDTVAAAVIYTELLQPGWPKFVQMGAFRGLAYAQPEQAPDRLLVALDGDDAEFRDLAAQTIAETAGPEATLVYADALPRLSAAGQVALLRGLAGRKDAGARAAVVQAIQSSEPEVKLAAAKALGALGNASDVPILAGLLASEDGDTAAAARTSLMSMAGADVDVAIAGAGADAAPAQRTQLFEVLAERRAEQAVPLALASLKDADATVRSGALDVLALLGRQEQIPDVLAALSAAADSSERSAAEKALGGIGARGGDAAVQAIQDAMNAASPELRVSLLRAIASTGSPKALEAVRAAIDDPDAQISGEAVSLLSNWPTGDAAPHLLALVQSEDPARKEAGLRGYLRLTGLNPSTEERVGMLTQVSALANRPEDKRMVLGAWGTVVDLRSFAALAPQLDDPAVQNEAAVAMISVAAEVGKNPDFKPQAVEALNTVIAKASNPDVKQRAQQVLDGVK